MKYTGLGMNLKLDAFEIIIKDNIKLKNGSPDLKFNLFGIENYKIGIASHYDVSDLTEYDVHKLYWKDYQLGIFSKKKKMRDETNSSNGKSWFNGVFTIINLKCVCFAFFEVFNHIFIDNQIGITVFCGYCLVTFTPECECYLFTFMKFSVDFKSYF